MNTDTTFPRKRIRFLGSVLLVLSGLALIAGLIGIPVSFFYSHALTSEYPDAESMAAEVQLMFLPEEITAETTVRELLEKDRACFVENRGRYQALSLVSDVFFVLYALVFLRLALAWRRAEPFGRAAIIGLRSLGILLIAQFFAGMIVEVLAPQSEVGLLYDLVCLTSYYDLSIDSLAGGGPVFSSGILFLLLSWVLDYGRQIREEQSLTI